jgi:hypothetical protein
MPPRIPLVNPEKQRSCTERRNEAVDAGFGIEKLSLTATMTEPLEERQAISSLVEDTVADVTPLLDVLGNRGG